jgi:hypothetical protein
MNVDHLVWLELAGEAQSVGKVAAGGCRNAGRRRLARIWIGLVTIGMAGNQAGRERKHRGRNEKQEYSFPHMSSDLKIG